MKILFLNHNLAGRGTYFRCMGFARELVKRGHAVDLWTCASDLYVMGTERIEDGVRVWRTPRWGGLGDHDGGYAPVDNLARLIQTASGQWDIVHAFDHRPNVLLPWLSLKFRQRCFGSDTLFMADWCDWWTAGGITTGRRRFPVIDRIEQCIEEGSKRMAEGVTVISSVLEERSLDAGVDRERLLLLPSGVDTEQFPLLERDSCREKLGLPLGRIILGFVGFSLWDMELLADTFERVRSQRPDVSLLVIGGGVEEKANQIFRNRFDIGRDVFLPGAVPFSQVPQYLGACDIQLLPMNDTAANRARLPNKLCDYMASGRPIAASDIGEGGKIVKENQIGVAAPEGPDGLVSACLSIIQNPRNAQNYGENARKQAETQYSYECLTDVLLTFYCQHQTIKRENG